MQVFLTRQQRLLTLGELAAGLAHQIRTPLAAALLYASQMTLAGRNAADMARCAEKTVESLKQLDKLVHDMLAFAHGGAAREAVSVSALLEQVAQWLRPALRDGIRLTIRTQAPQLMVRANAPSLVSAVLNLATNALQSAAAPLDLEFANLLKNSVDSVANMQNQATALADAYRAGDKSVRSDQGHVGSSKSVVGVSRHDGSAQQTGRCVHASYEYDGLTTARFDPWLISSQLNRPRARFG